MDLLEARDEGTGKEKHKPILADEDEVVVKVGENPHPMDEDHCIQWIEIQADDQVIRQILEAGDQPLARFKLDPEKVKKLTLRSYCNIHGLWES
jgi:superoxide reductase